MHQLCTIRDGAMEKVPDCCQLDLLQSPAPPFISLSVSQPIKWVQCQSHLTGLQEDPAGLSTQSTKHQAQHKAIGVLTPGAFEYSPLK